MKDDEYTHAGVPEERNLLLMAFSNYKAVIVGSGLFGLRIAEHATSEGGILVLVLDKGSHIGGNA